jgi:MoxR-like ATPase
LRPPVQDYAIRLVGDAPGRSAAAATTSTSAAAAARRASTLVLAAKVGGFRGRYNVSFEDIRKVYLPALAAPHPAELERRRRTSRYASG